MSMLLVVMKTSQMESKWGEKKKTLLPPPPLKSITKMNNNEKKIPCMNETHSAVHKLWEIHVCGAFYYYYYAYEYTVQGGKSLEKLYCKIWTNNGVIGGVALQGMSRLSPPIIIRSDKTIPISDLCVRSNCYKKRKVMAFSSRNLLLGWQQVLTYLL